MIWLRSPKMKTRAKHNFPSLSMLELEWNVVTGHAPSEHVRLTIDIVQIILFRSSISSFQIRLPYSLLSSSGESHSPVNKPMCYARI